jgi:hypothetical protein
MASMYRVRAKWQYPFGGPGLSTFYFTVTGGAPGSSADATTVAGRVRGAFDVAKTLLSTSTTVIVNPQVDVISDVTGDLVGGFSITPPATVTGTVAGNDGPTAIMAGMRLLTNDILGGRRVRGRSFFGPISGTLTNFPTPQAGIVTALNAFGVALITATPPSAVAPAVVWNRPKPGVGGSMHQITSVTVAPDWWVMRSRRDS